MNAFWEHNEVNIGELSTPIFHKKNSPISNSYLTQGSESNPVKSYNVAVPNCILL